MWTRSWCCHHESHCKNLLSSSDADKPVPSGGQLSDQANQHWSLSPSAGCYPLHQTLLFSTEMGDRAWVQFPVPDIYFGM